MRQLIKDFQQRITSVDAIRNENFSGTERVDEFIKKGKSEKPK